MKIGFLIIIKWHVEHVFLSDVCAVGVVQSQPGIGIGWNHNESLRILQSILFKVKWYRVLFALVLTLADGILNICMFVFPTLNLFTATELHLDHLLQLF